MLYMTITYDKNAIVN